MATPAKRRKRFSPVEIDSALAVLASSGSSFQASEITGIPSSTLRDWKVEHADRYREIQEREAPKLEAIAASQAREIIIRAGETEHSLLDLLNARIEGDAPTKELSEIAGTLQRVTTSKGINGTKLLELTGRPTQIIEHRDPKQEAQALARRLGVALEANAVEIHQPQLPRTEKRSLSTESGSANAHELQDR